MLRLRDLDGCQTQRLTSLLDEALDLPTERRAAWLCDLGEREEELQGLVVALLHRIASQGSVAETARLRGDADLIERVVARALASDPVLDGRMFGPYRVLRLLGRGGMGSVWLAERIDGLFDRQVALKLLHFALEDSSWTQRFARERRILGALEHPLIARLLDAGVTPDGQPYLALEYVAGTTLTAYCDDNRCSLRTRIELMVQVLVAVQYAHRNLVLHRDLKPANILVSHEGQVRLLDFGIAKLMVDGEAHETELTHFAGRVLTPDYASPEQLLGQALTTASDVYSLGVILYALLCGQRPYQLARDSGGALEQAVTVNSPEAIRPSQQALDSAIAEARGLTPARLHRALVGDLDTIVLRALKRDPVERYATADELMQDLQRHLNGEPVRARPDTFTYRCSKFIARYRWQVGGAALFASLLALAALVAIWQGHRAHTYAMIAQRSLVTFAESVAQQDERQGMAAALSDVEQFFDEVGERSSSTRAHLWLSQAQIQRDFSLDDMRSNADRALRWLRGPPSPWPCFRAASEVMGDALYLSGDYELAEAADRQALSEVARNDPGSLSEITPRVQLAEALYARLQLDEAERHFRGALATSRRNWGAASHATLHIQAKLGSFLHETGRRAEGMKLLEDASGTSASAALTLARADAWYARGDVAEAERAIASVVEQRRARLPDSIPLSRALLSHARALTALGRDGDSAAALAEAQRLWVRWGGRSAQAETFNPYVLESARLELARGDADAAEDWLGRISAPRVPQALRLDETLSQLLLAQVRMRQERWVEAATLAGAAVEHLRSSPLRARFPWLEAEAALRFGQARRQADDACDEIARAISLRSAQDVPSSPWLAEAKSALIDCLDRREVTSQAR